MLNPDKSKKYLFVKLFSRKKFEEVDFKKYNTDPKKIPKMIKQITNMYQTQVGTVATNQ